MGKASRRKRERQKMGAKSNRAAKRAMNTLHVFGAALGYSQDGVTVAWQTHWERGLGEVSTAQEWTDFGVKGIDTAVDKTMAEFKEEWVRRYGTTPWEDSA